MTKEMTENNKEKDIFDGCEYQVLVTDSTGIPCHYWWGVDEKGNIKSIVEEAVISATWHPQTKVKIILDSGETKTLTKENKND